MRLFNRLLLSHLLPVLVVAGALGLALVALTRISSDLDALEHSELLSLRREGDLHRAAWTLDVSMRHGEDDCHEGRATRAVAARISSNTDELAATLGTTRPISPAMHSVVEGYLDVAEEILARGACDGLLDARIDGQRENLDEELTNLWIARLDELHEQVTERGTEARRTASTALIGGVVVAGASALFALLVSGWLAGVLTRPLEALARSARRVGRGDFSTPVHAQGPVEVVELGAELERMRLQLDELEVLKQGFLASISHELRTPLSKIREALSLLHEGVVGQLNGKQPEVIRIARAACEREIRLVTTLLDLSRLRAGSPMRPRDGASIDDPLERAVEEEQEEAELRDVKLDVAYDGDAPRSRMDPILVERAIANLIRNAIAVSSPGQEVSIRRSVVARPDRSGRWIRICVTDHGPGVPQEIRESMFDTFVTRPVPRSSKGVGFGLGLALSREVVDAHGGELVLHSSTPAGATFHLWLPVQLQAPEGTTAE